MKWMDLGPKSQAQASGLRAGLAGAVWPPFLEGKWIGGSRVCRHTGNSCHLMPLHLIETWPSSLRSPSTAAPRDSSTVKDGIAPPCG